MKAFLTFTICIAVAFCVLWIITELQRDTLKHDLSQKDTKIWLLEVNERRLKGDTAYFANEARQYERLYLSCCYGVKYK
jgi:hypothetical protein